MHINILVKCEKPTMHFDVLKFDLSSFSLIQKYAAEAKYEMEQSEWLIKFHLKNNPKLNFKSKK